MKTYIIAGLIVVVVISIGSYFLFSTANESTMMSNNGRNVSGFIRDNGSRGKTHLGKKGKRKVDNKIGKISRINNDTRKIKATISNESEYTKEEQKIVDAIQSALDDNNLKMVKVQLKKASQIKNPEVRKKAAEALRWFGKSALAEITPFLADEDEEVRATAMDAVVEAMSQIDDEKQKVEYIEAIMQLKNVCTEDGLTMLSGELNGISDDALAVAAAARVIQANTNPEAVTTMKEVYEFKTGEEYTTPEAAEQWLAKQQVEEDGNNAECTIVNTAENTTENTVENTVENIVKSPEVNGTK